MQVGFIGSGNMAAALARGWGEPVLCSDSGSGRAKALAGELGGEALPNREVAERADLVILAHKPAQLAAVAAEVAGAAKAVVSILARRHAGRRARRLPGHARCSASSRTRRPRSAAACSRSPRPTHPSTRSCTPRCVSASPASAS